MFKVKQLPGVLVLALLAAAISANAQTTISLDSTVHYQTMTGWEAASWIGSECDPNIDFWADTLLALAANDAGINRLRLEIRSGAENSHDYYADWVANGCPEPPDEEYYTWRQNRYATVNDNADPMTINWDGFHFTELDWKVENVILPMRELVEANGEELHINMCYVAFTGQITDGSYHHDDPDEYAEFVLATMLHLDSTYGFVPNTWEILLEPDNVSQWNGTTLGQAMVATAARLQANGYTPRFVAPSNTSMANAVNYFNDMVAVPGAADHLEEYSYHRYGGSINDLYNIVDQADSLGVKTAMLEWWFGNATYEVLYEDLTVGRNSAWQGMVIRGMFNIDTIGPGEFAISYQNYMKFNRQYFKYVRYGAVRIEASSDNPTFAPLAWINEDGSRVVALKADGGGNFTITDLPSGEYGIKYTTASEFDVDLPDQSVTDGTLSASIPARGVITVYGKPTTDISEDTPSTVGGHQNPARERININYALTTPGHVTITVYNECGQEVVTLDEGRRSAGNHSVIWNGADNYGNKVPAGVYFCTVSSNGEITRSRKLLLLR